MFDLKVYPKYIKELLNLALPIIMGNMGIILIGACDVFVAAKYSTQALASISIANSIISTIFFFGIGLIVGVSPLLSNLRGEKSNIKKYFLPTINFAMLLAFISTVLILFLIPVIGRVGLEASLIPAIKNYMFICAFSTFGAYLQAALREYLQAFEIVVFPNFLNIVGVFVHLFLDFVFVFGWFHLPAMGVVGLAVATILSRTLMGLILFLYCLVFIRIRRYRDFNYFINLLKIGFPIAISIVLEVFAFNVITILIGRVSGVYAAAQNILLTLSTATFMIPMAISNAIAVKVGFANGAKNFVDLKIYTICGISISVGFMSLCAFGFIFFPKFFANIFTQDAELINICVPILILMGFFQIFDGLQVSLGGFFKGIKQTRIVMAGNFGAYWLIGLPLGVILAFKFKMYLFGFWVGLTASLILLGSTLLYIMLKRLKEISKSSNIEV